MAVDINKPEIQHKSVNILKETAKKMFEEHVDIEMAWGKVTINFM